MPQLNCIARRRWVFCLAGLFFAEVCLSQSTLILISNYDIKLEVEDEVQHITNQAKVRNGKTIPIEFLEHRIDITIRSVGGGKYRAWIDLYQKDETSWFKITEEDLTFEAMFAAPINLQWGEADISMDLSIAVSISNR